jgi:hypothetical protein
MALARTRLRAAVPPSTSQRFRIRCHARGVSPRLGTVDSRRRRQPRVLQVEQACPERAGSASGSLGQASLVAQQRAALSPTPAAYYRVPPRNHRPSRLLGRSRGPKPENRCTDAARRRTESAPPPCRLESIGVAGPSAPGCGLAWSRRAGISRARPPANRHADRQREAPQDRRRCRSPARRSARSGMGPWWRRPLVSARQCLSGR